MKRIASIALFSSCLAGMAAVLVFGLPGVLTADDDPNTFVVDVACDCRTGATLNEGVRGSPFIIQGKIFPAGTLPSGNASNDPTMPVEGVASIGNWICRGQVSGGFPPEIDAAYKASPAALNTQYFILDDGRALTVEGYDKPGGVGEFLSVTGGIGGFSGAAGFTDESPMGMNVTGCPNFRATVRFRPGSLHGDNSRHDSR